MIVICEACGVRYKVDTSNLLHKSVRGKCQACGHLFQIIFPEPSKQIEGIATSPTEQPPKTPHYPIKTAIETSQKDHPSIAPFEPYPPRTVGISVKIFLWICLAGIFPISGVWWIATFNAENQLFPHDIILVLALLVFFIFSALITRIITRPIKILAESAYRISMGDMDLEMDTQYQDEIGILAESFIRMRESVRVLIERAKRMKEEA